MAKREGGKIGLIKKPAFESQKRQKNLAREEKLNKRILFSYKNRTVLDEVGTREKEKFRDRRTNADRDTPKDTPRKKAKSEENPAR